MSTSPPAPSRTTRLSGRGRAFVAAGMALLALGQWAGSGDLVRAGVLLLALVLVVRLLAGAHRATLTASRTVSPAVLPAGVPARVDITVHNRSRRRSALMLATEHLPDVLGGPRSVAVAPIGPGEVRHVYYDLRPATRGRHQLGPLDAQVPDGLGLLRQATRVDGVGELLVLPVVQPLGAARPRANQLGTVGEHSSTLSHHGADDVTVREYRRGDDRRRIHWRSTARTGELMVRQEEQPLEHTAVVLLDGELDAFQGEAGSDAFEWAVSAAASVVVHLAESGYAAQLVTAETVRDGTTEVQHGTREVLVSLADARRHPRHEMPDLARAAHDLVSSGGLLVAVIGQGPLGASDAMRALAGSRAHGSTGLALVVGDHTMAPGRVSERTRYLIECGWNAVDCRPGEDLAQLWSGLLVASGRQGVIA